MRNGVRCAKTNVGVWCDVTSHRARVVIDGKWRNLLFAPVSLHPLFSNSRQWVNVTRNYITTSHKIVGETNGRVLLKIYNSSSYLKGALQFITNRNWFNFTWTAMKTVTCKAWWHVVSVVLSLNVTTSSKSSSSFYAAARKICKSQTRKFHGNINTPIKKEFIIAKKAFI